MTDLRVSNIAFAVKNFDGWSEEELYARLGPPRTEVLKTRSGKSLHASFPTALVEPVTFWHLDNEWLQPEIRLIDFGISFFESAPPEYLGTPAAAMAPEGWFENSYGKSSDIWALGCALWELRAASPLLEHTWGGNAPEAVFIITTILGEPPEKWRDMVFDDKGGLPRPRKHKEEEGWKEKVDKQTWTIQESWIMSLRESVEWIKDEYYGPVRQTDIEAAKTQEYYMGKVDGEARHVILPDQRPSVPLSAEEIDSFTDLLSSIVKWEPDERPSAEEISKHPWFTTNFTEARPADDAPPLLQSCGYEPNYTSYWEVKRPEVENEALEPSEQGDEVSKFSSTHDEVVEVHI